MKLSVVKVKNIFPLHYTTQRKMQNSTICTIMVVCLTIKHEPRCSLICTPTYGLQLCIMCWSVFQDCIYMYKITTFISPLILELVKENIFIMFKNTGYAWYSYNMLEKLNLEAVSYKNKLHLEWTINDLYTHFRCNLP